MTERNLGVDKCGTYYTKTPFNHDAEVKVVGSKSNADVQPTVVEIVEEAVARGDAATLERAVNRFRWDMDGSASTITEGQQTPIQKLQPRVTTVYRGDQAVSVFHPGIDFAKGDSLHF